jgi:hypothetical protein
VKIFLPALAQSETGRTACGSHRCGARADSITVADACVLHCICDNAADAC